MSAGNLGGGGELNIFFRGRNAHQATETSGRIIFQIKSSLLMCKWTRPFWGTDCVSIL